MWSRETSFSISCKWYQIQAFWGSKFGKGKLGSQIANSKTKIKINNIMTIISIQTKKWSCVKNNYYQSITTLWGSPTFLGLVHFTSEKNIYWIGAKQSPLRLQKMILRQFVPRLHRQAVSLAPSMTDIKISPKLAEQQPMA